MKINIGRYVPGNTWIHTLDARVKLLANISFIVLFFMANTFVLQALLLFPIIVAFLIIVKKPSKLFKTFKLPLWIGLFIFIINCFILKTNIPDVPKNISLNWSNWTEYNLVNLNNVFKINYQIIIVSINIMLRVYAIILIMTVLTASTQPILLTKALEFYLYPLKLLRIPIHIFIMIISIALRFVPTIVDESQRILKAQASRGTDFKNGGFRTKIKATIVLIVPLFVSAFSKAEDLANAMETRGYNPYEKRTSYRNWTTKWFDVIALIAIIGIIVITSIIINGNIIDLPQWWMNSKVTF